MSSRHPKERKEIFFHTSSFGLSNVRNTLQHKRIFTMSKWPLIAFNKITSTNSSGNTSNSFTTFCRARVQAPAAAPRPRLRVTYTHQLASPHSKNTKKHDTLSVRTQSRTMLSCKHMSVTPCIAHPPPSHHLANHRTTLTGPTGGVGDTRVDRKDGGGLLFLVMPMYRQK